MRFFMILVIFMLMNAFLITSNNNLKLNNIENIKQLTKEYTDWIKSLGNNLTEITGQIINSKWIIKTNSSE